MTESKKTALVRQPRGNLSRERLTDHIRPGVRILFVGINPGLRSAATGHHFAGYSNRFWKLLFESELVSEPLTYLDDWRLPDWGLGLTNIIQRPSAGIDVLKPREYTAGRRRLMATVTQYRRKGSPCSVSQSIARCFRTTRQDESASDCKKRPWPTALSLSCLIRAAGMPTIHTTRC
jgi:mismatch-specific thymine-DNA glycosylase